MASDENEPAEKVLGTGAAGDPAHPEVGSPGVGGVTVVESDDFPPPVTKHEGPQAPQPEDVKESK